VKQSSGPGRFEIQLVYYGVRTSRIVNDNMPVKTLFAMAIAFLNLEFGFGVEDDHDVDLVYSDTLMQRDGTLGSVPVLRGALIHIVFPMEDFFQDHGSTPDTCDRKGGPPRVLPGSATRQASRSSKVQPTPVLRSPTRTVEDEPIDEFRGSPSNSLDPRSYDKIRQSFKCPRFSGQAKEWKMWDKGFLRYLSIWELDYVLNPSFFDVLPLSSAQRRDNKLVYFVIKEAVQASPLALSYIRQVPVHNGFEAYYTLHDGYVFAGTTTATLMLNELSNFRFLSNETPTELCLRLEELFQELFKFVTRRCCCYVCRHSENWVFGQRLAA
jgi:hypothetical protein